MKKWELSRRTLLRGAGALMALPLLEQMLPSVARAQTAGAPPPRRLVAIYVPNGIYMPLWTPTDTGREYTLTPSLEPLAPVKEDVLVLTGLANRPAIPNAPGDHASGTGAFLTCTPPVRADGAGVQCGISMDQVAARQLGAFTRFPSLELGTQQGSSVGTCDSGFSCVYSGTISWASPTTPLAKEVDPQAVFDRLFAVRRSRYQQSALDAVQEDAHALQQRLGSTDRRKVDEYFTAVRELEVRLARQAEALPASCTPGAGPGTPGDLRERTRAMLDLIVLAFQCDQTRVVTLMMGNSGSSQVLGFLGLSGGHHAYSHHQGLPENIDALARIQHWEVEQFVSLVQRLKAVQEGEGTLLDSSVVLFSSEIEDGNAHRHTNLPVLLAGRGGGALLPGRHVRYADAPPLANLYISLLQAVGTPVSTFGQDGTAPLPLLASEV